MLDIIQSFRLLSYCIVSPIYISPIYNVDFKIHYSVEIIKLGILYFFSLFTNRMPSSVLNWASLYHRLFRNNSLFPIDPKIFGCICFVRDVHP